jgi:CubicO group peptidase (beta-lactamase class C family)
LLVVCEVPPRDVIASDSVLLVRFFFRVVNSMGFPTSMAIAMSGSVLAGCVVFAVGPAPTAGATVGTAKTISNFSVNRYQERFTGADETPIGSSGESGSDARRREPDPAATGPSTAAADGPEEADTGTAPDPPVTSSAPQGGDQTSAAMQAYLRKLAANKEFTGAALVLRRGQVLARFAAGEADAENHIPVRPDTVFRVASVTKQFTSMLMLKQRDRGLLNLDDAICPYLIPVYIKACPTMWRPITIRQILTHTSGIPDYQELPDFYPNLSKPTTTPQLIQRFVHRPLDFEPGTSWKYSSSGYILAGAIIQSVTNRPYGAVLDREITGPLSLEHTGYSRGDPPPGTAKGYFTLGSAAPPINGSQAFSAAGMFSNVDDIARWDRAFGAFRVAPPSTVKEAFTPQARCPVNGCLNLPSSAYAFGWLVDRLQGHRVRYHPGLLQGYAASNMYLPDDDIVVVVLSNVQDTAVNVIARHLATLALEP